MMSAVYGGSAGGGRKMIKYPNSACEEHLNVKMSEPVCVICMSNRIAELETEVAMTKLYATEDALRWAWMNSRMVDDSQFVDEVVRVGLNALLGGYTE